MGYSLVFMAFFFALEEMVQFEFVILFLMQLPSHQIVFREELNSFHWKSWGNGLVQVLLLARNSLGRKLKQLELMMYWPNIERNF